VSRAEGDWEDDPAGEEEEEGEGRGARAALRFPSSCYVLGTPEVASLCTCRHPVAAARYPTDPILTDRTSIIGILSFRQSLLHCLHLSLVKLLA
jgi:hypothetical protein